ncbi:TonB-dependent receptor [Novosphingobium album (ex Hu et al. 2023)]|uniref:TonB-dependent receptor n=1 Tax=Novosphingobium album (ex Hu et al. 2023) TaxID=2930093 RepID=A0ABT0AZ49_9SPHN|nr:TonB-dependent receptor [Novosphingobium album (ex Hu et al. 2023)]MCJ2178041.1 TonB-dependent receptor [Novosphingobium album (ex Hu et al. 2023)]
MAQQASSAKTSTSRSAAASSNDAGYQDEIVVTGQAVPGAVIGDIPPENQLGRAEIESYGVDSISDLLDEIADQTTSIEGRDSSSGPVVLVNGKRVSGVNEVGDLPVESVLRVDILPEEVALKYGYDAQKKVVNIILKRRFQSKVINLDAGMSAEGGGGQGQGAFTYTRIHDNDRLNLLGRVKTQAAILESDRDIEPDADSGVTEAAGLADDRAYRTLQDSTRSYELNASLAHELSSTANASFNLRGSYDTSRALDGLATGALTIPADNPYGDGTETEITRYLSDRALVQKSETGSVSAGGTVNVELSTRWRVSVIGSYEHSQTDTHTGTGYDLAAIQDALDAGDTAVDPYGVLPSDLLGSILTNRAKSNTDTASASMLLNGKLFAMPAGDVGVSVKLGGDFTSQTSSSMRNGTASDSDAERTNGSAQLSFDVPLTSSKKGVQGSVGTLSANFNGGITQVSDYGSLATFGYGLNWAPVSGVTIIAAVNEDRSAPTVSQLGSPVLTTTKVRVYDYVSGNSVLVTRTSGGNPDLKADDRHVFKLGLNATLLSEPKLNFSATYADSRNRNAIMSLGGVTADLEDAYPDRYVRDASGELTDVDTRSVNVYRQHTEQVRWGFNFSAVLRKPKRPPRPPRREDAAGGQGGEGARQWQPGQQPNEGGPASAPDQQGQGAEGGPGQLGSEITVTGSREEEHPDRGFGPPPDGFGPPPDGMGPPPDGMGPPPGGFGGPGGPGGPRGPGGRGFFGGSDNGARLLLSLYHTWLLRDEVQLTADSGTIDLLHGGTLTGSTSPQHQIQAKLGVIDNGVGLRFDGTWKSGTDVTGDTASSGDLHFSSLFTLDLRLFANLQNRFRGKGWARGTRVSFSVENLFDQRQRVTDGMGATPYAYQPDYLDPMGRTVKLSLRRIF